MTPARTARDAFLKTFGREPDGITSAPGRVNLIGEHTDYNDGFVLPAAIQYRTAVAFAATSGDDLRVHAVNYDDTDTIECSAPPTRSDKTWTNYVRGVVGELISRGVTLKGADLAVAGNVPEGAGLSSSAAFEVALGTALSELNDLALAPQEIALIGQAAENNFVGTRCGIMDQLVSAKAEEGSALLIDCRSLETTPVPLPLDLEILIVNSNIRRGLVTSAYNDRRNECEAAARLLGVPALRDITLDDFEAQRSNLPPLIARRAAHVVSENARTLAAADALRAGDRAALSALMAASHRSMRDDFEITVPPIDLIVEIVAEIAGDAGGVRMTGGGFGGCVVALLPQDLLAPVQAAVEKCYSEKTGQVPAFYRTRPAAGADLVED